MYCMLDELGSVYKTPCVVFTGHPSLRCGDAVHFMEEWGSNNDNAVMFTGTGDVCSIPLMKRYSLLHALLGL